MRTETLWAPPLMAVQLLTRVPLPWLARLDAAQAQAATRRMLGWLPLAGTLVGIVTATVFVAALQVFPPAVAAGLALAVEAMLTGAFHEDAAADFADGFGGHAAGEEARRIMKDSRIGSYGALWLVLLVGLRWSATAALPAGIATAAIVAAATLGRLWAVLLMRLAPPRAGDGGLAASVGTPDAPALLLAVLVSIPAAAMLAPVPLLAAGLAGVVALPLLARAIRRRVGGSTGDCLGVAAILGQLATLLAVLAA